MIEVIPTGAVLGTEIHCSDVRNLDDTAMAEIRRAWLDHLVLVFRSQILDKAELIAFGRRFGNLHHGTRRPAGMMPRDENFPEINVISNVIENGLKLGNLGASEALWHTDRSHQEKPLSASLLYAIEVPPLGGDTSWANMYRAFETMPAAMKDRIAKLTIHHDASRDSAGAPRADFKGTGAHHPIVRTHPETGASALYLGRRSNTAVDGLSEQDSNELLDELWAHAARPELVWTHQWRVGDIVIWDNRCTIHHRTAFDLNARRIMYRLQVDGTRPFMDTDALSRPAHARAGLAAPAN